VPPDWIEQSTPSLPMKCGLKTSRHIVPVGKQFYTRFWRLSSASLHMVARHSNVAIRYLSLPFGRLMPRKKLSDRGIRSLKAPGSRQVDYWDSLTPGFGIRVGHGGRKSFIVGTPLSVCLVSAFRVALKRFRVNRRNRPSMLSKARGAKLRTRGEMQRKLDVELLPHWADRPIASITRSEIKSLLREKAVIVSRYPLSPAKSYMTSR
jgi:hypothetical protein